VRLDSNLLSEALKRPFKTHSQNQKYNLSSNQKQVKNQDNFVTLGNLSEQEKIEIIQTGFQLQAKGKISLKNYSQSRKEYSLFQSKGYQKFKDK
jgi:hypothetical protein